MLMFPHGNDADMRKRRSIEDTEPATRAPTRQTSELAMAARPKRLISEPVMRLIRSSP